MLQNTNNNYSLSFTGSALRRPESVILARHYYGSGDWYKTRKAAIDDNLLVISSLASRQRIASELLKRLTNLSDTENCYLINTAPSEQNLILWIAVCRTYQFIDDFSREVLAKRLTSSSNVITTGVFESFFDEQAAIHPELSKISEQTHSRLRRQLKQMMYEAGLINDNGRVLMVYLPLELIALLDQAGRNETTIFPTKR